MSKTTSPRLEREIAHAASTVIDTTTTLDDKFRRRRSDALALSDKARQARGAAARWLRRSSAYASVGEFRAADDAQTEGVALGRMASDLELEIARLRSTGRDR